LCQPTPITVADESLTRREIALLDAPMAQVNRPGRGVVVTNGRERQDQLDISPQLRLVVFDDHAIIPTLVDNSLRDMALSQERVHGDNTAFQDQVL
jgi:hypothetical protein